MDTSLNGVCFYNSEDGKTSFCIVEKFSEELKELIRENLTSICHGPYRSKYEKKSYHYKKTVKQFNSFSAKYDLEKYKGLVGELLAHIFIKYFNKDMRPVSLFFNMEENSMTKGYDILFAGGNSSKLWVVEVKSGQSSTKDYFEEHKGYLGTAKTQLKSNLNSPAEYRWRKAKNAIDIGTGFKKEKVKIKEILNRKEDEAIDGIATSLDCNVVLVSTLYTSSKKNILPELETLQNTYFQKKEFNDLYVFSINKKTFEKVITFLEQEGKS